MHIISLFSASRFLAVFALVLAVAACAGDQGKGFAPEESVNAIYTKGMDALDQGDFKEAVKQFAEVDRQHPYSQWAARAQIMEAYAHYQNMEYDEAIECLTQFIELRPGNSDIPYAYYLRALSNYERILDVRRDQTAAREAQKGLQEVVSRFPDTEYAKDAVLKLSLINDHLAGAEMDVGRFYIKQTLYIAAVNRFKTVVDRYQTTSHVPEALERLVECYMALGLVEEAKRNAAVLGHNFPGSSWYQDAYSLMQDAGVVLENSK